MPTSPNQRTVQLYRRQGYHSQVVERFNHFSRTRHDLFGFIDGISVGHGRIIGWQATTGSNLSSRLEKIKGECADKAAAWLEAGGELQVIGWRKLKVKRGGKAVRWEPIIRHLTAGGTIAADD